MTILILFYAGLFLGRLQNQTGRVNDQTIEFVDRLNQASLISYEFSDYLFKGSASRDAEIAGIKGALIGSIWTLGCLPIDCFPAGRSNGRLPGGDRTQKSNDRNY
jgi:phosphate transport system permease protein